MKPTYDEIVQWMKDYFADVQPATPRTRTPSTRMDKYFAPDLTLHALHVRLRRARKPAITSSEDFYRC